MNTRSSDFSSGALLFAFGALFMERSLHLETGSFTSMGPGYFPMILSSILCTIGLALMARGLFADDVVDRIGYRPLVAVAAAASYGLLVEPIGVLFASAVTATIALSAMERLSVRSMWVITTCSAITGVLAYALGLPSPLLP